MKERKPFTRQLSPEYLLLGMLKISPSHGYDLHQQIERDLRYVWRLSLSQVYNVLSRLEERGMITGKLLAQDERPDRRRFQLSPAGEQQFEQWFTTPVGASVHAVRIAFLSKVYFAQQIASLDLPSLWEKQVEVIEKGLQRLASRRDKTSGAHPILEHSLQLRSMQLQTLLDWMHENKNTLAQGLMEV